ncbi:hypothetical protein HRH25_22765 [Flavisolibacter sp. BT320]|nr:hypothetical protein [Flavisolibacter longurius]
MSTLLAFRHKETNQAETKEDVALVIKWNAKDFLNIFGMLLVFSLLILSFLFGLSWLIYSFIDSNLEPTGKLYLRMLFTGSIMCLVMAAILFTCNRLGISWEFRS